MLGNDIAAALPGLRAEAESRMTDMVVAGSFKDATDPVTGSPTRVPVVQRYAGKGRFRLPNQAVTNANGPSMPYAMQEPTLSIPFGSPRLLVGDEVEFTGSTDPILIGRRFRVQGNAQSGQTTAHRYALQEIS